MAVLLSGGLDYIIILISEHFNTSHTSSDCPFCLSDYIRFDGSGSAIIAQLTPHVRFLARPSSVLLGLLVPVVLRRTLSCFGVYLVFVVNAFTTASARAWGKSFML